MSDLSNLWVSFSKVLPIYIEILQFDFWRYFLAAGGFYLLVNVLFAANLSDRKIRQDKPATAQMWREFLASTRTVLIFATVGFAIFLGSDTGIFRTYAVTAELGWWYFAVSVAVLIVLHDAWFYWTHRLIHDPRLFRRFHRLHHKSNNPSPWAAYAFDTGEAVINAVYLPLILLILPASYLAIFVFTTHMIIRNVMAHCGYELFPAARDGRPLFAWSTTTTHHDLHHAQAGWNYGFYFTFWDRVMGTEHPDYLQQFENAARPDKSRIAKRSNTVVLALAAVSVLSLSATILEVEATELDDIEGVWATQGHGAHVEMLPCAHAPDKLCGKIIWAWDKTELQPGYDAAYMLKDFVWADGRWAGGKLHNPEDGNTYRGTIRLRQDGGLAMEGCAFIFCQKQVWRRVSDIPGCKPRP